LRAHGLALKRSKCLFAEQRIHYLGHVIANDSVAMDADKVSAVQAWPLPKTIKALRVSLASPDTTGSSSTATVSLLLH
jgi:hypothetical protein